MSDNISTPADPSTTSGSTSSSGSTSTPTTVSGKPSHDHDPLRGSKASGVWISVVALVVLLVLLAIFVLQNTQSVEVSYFGWTGTAPLASTLIIAAALGLLIAVMAGSLRILQLRRRVRKERKR